MARKKKDTLEPGNYTIEIVKTHQVYVDPEDELTEDDLISETCRLGELVDWDVQKI
jgi:hypothetical protein